MAWCNKVWHGYDMVLYSKVWYTALYHHIVFYGVVYDVICKIVYGMIWYLIWYISYSE